MPFSDPPWPKSKKRPSPGLDVDDGPASKEPSSSQAGNTTRSRWRAGHAAPNSRGWCVTRVPGRRFTSLRYGERLAELGELPSIGSAGDRGASTRWQVVRSP